MKIHWDRCVWSGNAPEDESFVAHRNPATAMLDACINRQVLAYCREHGVVLAIRERTGSIFRAEVLGPVGKSASLPAAISPGDYVTLPYTAIGIW